MQSVKIPLAEFIKAAAVAKMKRAPKGARGQIERRTILEFHPNFLVVDAPFQSQVIQVKCGFRETFIINGLQLSVTLQKLPKAEFIDLCVDKKSNTLLIMCEGLKITLKGGV